MNRPDSNAVDNCLAQVLTDQYGFLPLDVRYGAAAAARHVVDQFRLATAPATPTAPKPEPWSNMLAHVCDKCGCLVTSDRWRLHERFHIALDQVANEAAVNAADPARVDEQRTANDTAARREKLWHAQLCVILECDDRRIPFEFLIGRVQGAVLERDRLRALEQVCIEAGASGSTPERIEWVRTLISDRGTLTELFRGLNRAVGGTSGENGRDWNADYIDTWLFALFVGWDCEEDHIHDPDCYALSEVAQKWGWTPVRTEWTRAFRRLIASMQKRPPTEVDKAAIEKTLTEGFEDEPAAAEPCPSLYLDATGELCACILTKVDDPELHTAWASDGSRVAWREDTAVPVPWPVDQEPPPGIDLLHDPDGDQSGTAWLHRMRGGWEWFYDKKPVSGAIADMTAVSWSEAVAENEGRRLLVVKL